MVSAINIEEVECCLDPENRKTNKYNIARYAGDQ